MFDIIEQQLVVKLGKNKNKNFKVKFQPDSSFFWLVFSSVDNEISIKSLMMHWSLTLLTLFFDFSIDKFTIDGRMSSSTRQVN